MTAHNRLTRRDMRQIQPEDLLESSWLDSYQEAIEAVWWQLVRLNSTLFVLEKIHSFPFDVLMPPGPLHFWDLIEASFFDTCVMIIWRVAVDNQFKEGLTLRQLKNAISRHLRQEYRDQFKELLKDVEFEKAIGTYEPKIYELRHNYIAHFNVAKHINPSPEHVAQRTLLISELRNCRDVLNSLFDLLCFGHQRALLPFEYHPDIVPSPDLDLRSDIEHLLDDLARHSSLLNMPEEKPDYWSTIRKNLTGEQFRVLNEYREKFGLPQV